MSTDGEDGQRTIQRLKTKPLERNLALAKLGVGAGARIAAHTLGNIFRGEVSRSDADRKFFKAQAQVLADELGQLKGSVMKAGQMLALFGDYFLPEEAVEVLRGLQDATPPVAWAYVEPVLRRELSAEVLAELEISPTPLAAASLGQAHRAKRKSDGRDLVVKIQYPGVADAIDSDIKTLSRLMMATRLVPKNLDLAPIFTEVREMLVQECDYQKEAAFTQEFAKRLQGDARYAVPEVLTRYSSARVLTTSFEAGVGVQDPSILGLSQARRNQLAYSFAELFVREFFLWHTVQTDPHFGNYRVRMLPDGTPQLVLLDFGATRRFSPQWVQAYGQVVGGALRHDRTLLRQGAEAIGLIEHWFPPAAFNDFAELCDLIVEPFDPERAPAERRTAAGDYRFAGSNLPMRVSNVAARSALSVAFKMPPRELVFLHRRLGGVFMALVALSAELNLKPLVLHAGQPS